MNYFINTTLHQQNSGIEHAQFQRATVFRQHQLPFKLLYMTWNPWLYQWANQVGVVHDYLNLFDYYQDFKVATGFGITPDQLLTTNHVQLLKRSSADSSQYDVFQNGNVVQRIKFVEQLKDDRLIEQVSVVENMSNGQCYQRDTYDVRGWRSRSQLYDSVGRLRLVQWFNVVGKPVITQIWSTNVIGKSRCCSWEIIDHQNVRHHCRTFQEVVTQFINDLNQTDEPNTFVIDRAEGFSGCLFNLKRPATKLFHLHNNHTASGQNPTTQRLNEYYDYALANRDRYDGFIVATKEQQHDLQTRYGQSITVMAIPVGVTHMVKEVEIAQRRPHSILVTARRAPEKRLDQIVALVAKAREQVPDITLDIFGYPMSNSGVETKLSRYQSAHWLSVNDYQTQLDDVRDQHEFYIVFSTMEGFNLGLMEALNHGEIGLVNDVKYGPGELVQDGQNGYVVAYNDADALSQRLVAICQNPQLAQTLSYGSYRLSKRFEDASVYQAWMKLFQLLRVNVDETC